MARIKKAKRQNDVKSRHISRWWLVFAGVVGLIGAVLLIFGLADKTELTVSYSEAGSGVDYRVYLLPNNSYAESYIYGTSDRSYPTSLIKYLDLAFNYSAHFDAPVEGELRYKMVALTSADKVDNANSARLWSDEQELYPEQSVNISGQTLSIRESAKINYDQYANMIRRFEAEAQGVSAKGSLNVALVISGTVKPENFEEAVPLDSRVDFIIPIASNSSVEAKTSIKNGTDATLRAGTASLEQAHLASIISGAVLLAIAAGVGIYCFVTHRLRLRAHPYETKVKHLLSAYDGVIVETSRIPSARDKNISDVADFDELLDVYNSVHLPINYYHDRNKSYFVISGDKNTWRYIIKKSDFNKHGQKD